MGLSWALASTGKLPDALKEARRAVELAPNAAAAHTNLAWVYGKEGRLPSRGN